MTPPQKFLVLGGGLSGLLAAWHLRRQGMEVEVWEAMATEGGWAQTLAWPGPQGEPAVLERGPQSLRAAAGSSLERLFQDLNLELNPNRPKGPRWLGRGGGRHPNPASFAGLLRTPGLGLGARFRILMEPFIPAGGTPEESLQAFFSRRLGEGFAREWLPALAAGVLAAPPERIALEALPRLRELESRGGLLVGGLRAGREHTYLPVGGTGALAQTLAEQLGCIHTHHAAQALKSLPDGRWRVSGEGIVREVEVVILALPARPAAALLRPLIATAADMLEAIPQLDLRVWHSRHPRLEGRIPGWERGFGLLIHPSEGRGLLGAVSLAADDPRGVPGLLQIRTYVGGAYPVADDLETWPGVFHELRRWLPELEDPIQTRLEVCPGAFPLLEPGHGGRLTQILQDMPPNLHWLGAARFGPGIPDLAEGIEAWARTLLDV